MSELALFRRLATTCKQVFQFPLPTKHPKFRQQHRHDIQQELKNKEILTLDEAAVYLSIDSETLLEEVHLGKLPGRQLGEEWRFSLRALEKSFV